MKNLLATMLVCLLAATASAAATSASPVFQVRLVLDSPSADSEPMALVRKADGHSYTNILNVQKLVLLDQTSLKSAAPNTDALGHPVIDLTFTEKGKQEFADVTARNLGKQLAIVIHGQVYQAPVVRSEIKGGKAQISGSFTKTEAEGLAREVNEVLAR